MLRVDNLKVRGLRPFSFELKSGDCIAVQGPSGSGKSLLLRAIADLDPAEGQIFLEGAERCEMSGPEWRRRVRYASAEPGWWAVTARAHFAADARIERLVSSLGLDPSILDRPVAELSTGERQRLALIRALADNPKVLLLDEPTAALDTEATALMEELIKFQALSDKALVIVTHDAAQAGRLAQRRIVLEGGAMAIKAL